jgi:hypothetical protein
MCHAPQILTLWRGMPEMILIHHNTARAASSANPEELRAVGFKMPRVAHIQAAMLAAFA